MTEKKKTKTPAKKKSAKAAKATKARKKTPAKKKVPVKARAKGKPASKRKPKAPPKATPTPVYEHVFDNPLNVKRVIYGLFAVCGILFIFEFFVTRHVEHPWEGLFGFYAVYGFVACVVLVLVAKEMRKVLMRGEDYYDE